MGCCRELLDDRAAIHSVLVRILQNPTLPQSFLKVRIQALVLVAASDKVGGVDKGEQRFKHIKGKTFKRPSQITRPSQLPYLVKHIRN